MNELVAYLSGKKTYLVAILYATLGIIQQDQDMVLQAVLIFTGRSALKKLEK